MKARSVWIIATTLIAQAAMFAPRATGAADYVVYSVYKELDLGNPGEVPQKDFYVNMGTAQGVQEGSMLKVFRRVSTYDLISEKLYRDVSFPIARIKVIHAESNAAIARLEKMLPLATTPAFTPRAIMVGDLVELAD